MALELPTVVQIDTEIDLMFELPGIPVSQGSQRLFTKIIKNLLSATRYSATLAIVVISQMLRASLIAVWVTNQRHKSYEGLEIFWWILGVAIVNLFLIGCPKRQQTGYSATSRYRPLRPRLCPKCIQI
jgi:DNA transposition AAA+ family ATPase